MHSYGEERRREIGLVQMARDLILYFFFNHQKGSVQVQSPLTDTEYVVCSFIVGYLSRKSVIHCVIGKVIIRSFFCRFWFRFHCSSIIKKGVSATVDILVNRLRLERG
jgi:hypothetical protein